MKIQEFIKNNNLSFKEGNRNTTIVVIIGYSQHLGVTQPGLKTELDHEIEDDSFISEEISRLWDYCKTRNYKNFWTTDKAKELYKF